MARPGTRVRDHRANIACIESLWNSDVENRLSVVPILDLVCRINRIKYTHLTCNTREELAYNLGRLGKGRGYRMLYLSLHGKPGEIILDGGRTDLESLAGMMGTRFAGWAVHFGSCSTIAVPLRRIRDFMGATSVAMLWRHAALVEDVPQEQSGTHRAYGAQGVSRQWLLAISY